MLFVDHCPHPSLPQKNIAWIPVFLPHAPSCLWCPVSTNVLAYRCLISRNHTLIILSKPLRHLTWLLFAVYEQVCCLWASLLFMGQFVVYEPVCCLLASLLFMSQFALYEPLWCLWASLLFMGQFVGYEPVSCLWVSLLFTGQFVVY